MLGSESVTIIGRGNSGTRTISHTLTASGVFMGEPINESGDLLPPESMYEACRIFGRHVAYRGNYEWDWSATAEMAIPEEFVRLITTYLSSIATSTAPRRGWKIPETTLVFPWIARLYPDIKYIFWIRDPRDNTFNAHLTDDLSHFAVPCPDVGDDVALRRAISWKYQYDLVRATCRPAQWHEVRFEDFVLKQRETLARLEAFIGMPLASIPVRREPVGRWQTLDVCPSYDFLQSAMLECGYSS